MKSNRIHIYIVIGLFLVTFIIGSFVDLNLSQAVFQRGHAFGLTLSAIGTIPGYGCFGIIAGMCLCMGLEKPYKTLYKVILFAGAVAALGAGVFFAGREFFGENGFYNEKLKWLGFIIALPIMLALGYLGFRIAHNSDNQRLWLVLIIVAIAIFMALVPGVTLIKAIFHRPRFRTLSSEIGQQVGIYFHNWWERTPDYKSLIEQYNNIAKVEGVTLISSEEFKSFPSGHAGAASVFMMCSLMLPLVNQKFEKIKLPLFYGGLAWTLLIAFSRIFAGAHFLSDVSMGALLTMICTLILNEVLIKVKSVHVEENNKQLEKE